MLPAFLTTIFFSLSAITGNRCARIFGGAEANFYRMTIATLLLGIYVLGLRTWITGAAATTFALSGIVGVGIGDLLFFLALPKLGTRLTVLVIQCLSVPFAALVEWLWLGTTLTSRQLVWSSVIVTGIAIAFCPLNEVKSVYRKMGNGIWFAIAAAFGNGFGAVLSRKAYAIAADAGMEVNGFSATFHRLLGGIIVALITILLVRWSFFRSRWSEQKFRFSKTYLEQWKEAWPWVLGTSLAGQTLGVACFQWALKSHPTGVVLPIVAMTPLVAIPIAHVFEGERPGIRSIIGGIIAVGGVIALLAS